MSRQEQIRILLVEDDEIDFFLFSNYIRETGDKRLVVEWCDDYTKALFKMADEAYDLYFVDYRLGESTALELLEEMSRFGFQQPVIVLTGKGSRDIDIKAMERGATDYLVKSDLTAEKLERCIRYALDRSKAVASIRDSENKYRSLFEKSGDAIFITDHFLFLREVNKACCKLFDMEEETLTTHNLYHFLEEAHTGRHLYNALENNEPVNNLEIIVKTEQQNKRNCLLTISSIEYNGRTMFHCILRDITELRRASNVNVQLEKMDTTEKLIRMLGHEIRNPLTNIGLAAEGLSQQARDEDERLLLDIINRNTSRINQLLSELIDSTRSGNFHFELASLQDIMEETLASYRDRIALQKVEVSKSFGQQACYIMADREKLKIALGNLVINAVEAMPANQGKLTIEVAGFHDQYFLKIRDNGHGIPKEFLPRLFEPFSTLKKKGLGLGLSTAFNIISKHQGSIDVESELNEGTLFRIHFPKKLVVLTNKTAPSDEVKL